VVDGLKKIGVGGVTVLDVRGRGSSELPVIGGLRGTAKFVAVFNLKNAVTTIVDDSKVEEVISTILDNAGTGSIGDGKIFVSNIEEMVDIGSKKRGDTAL